MDNASDKIVSYLSQIIYDKKGINILVLDVREFSNVTDFLIIAEGNVERHVAAIANEIIRSMREDLGVRPHHVEGLHVGEWILLDYANILIHLFKPGMREKYQLEQLWSKGKIVSNTFVPTPDPSLA